MGPRRIRVKRPGEKARCRCGRGPLRASAGRGGHGLGGVPVRTGCALGEDGPWQPPGPNWGDHSAEPWLNLTLHAMDEIVRHGAELTLLRDLYRSGHAG